MGTPSTCAQFLPGSDRYAIDSRPPAYRLLDLRDDGRIHSEIRWVKSEGARRTAAS
jgi:Icc protein